MAFKSIEITPVKYFEQEIVQRSQIYKGYSTVDNSLPSIRLYDYDLIKQDIINQFQIRKGERVMNPDFGTIIWDLLFDPFTDSVKSMIGADINRILTSDPRVVPTDIQVTEEEYGMMLEITLTHVGTNKVDTMRLTFDKTVGLMAQ